MVHIHHISSRSIDSGGTNSYSVNKKPLSSDNNSRDSNNSVPGAKLAAHSKNSEGLIRGPTTQLRLSAFGQPLNLTLVRTEGLIKKGGLKLWSVEPNATAQHGVEYVEIPEVSFKKILFIFKRLLFVYQTR